MKKLLILSLGLWGLRSTPALAQSGGSSVAVVSVRRLASGRTRVVLTQDGKTTEELVLKVPFTDDGQDEVTTGYQQLITKLYGQGYSLKSTFSQDEGHFTTLVFTKGQ